MNRYICWLLVLVGIGEVNGRDWYAAPSGQLDGDGSLAKPWALQIALASANLIQPGDTLYMRGGVYKGPGYISSLSGTANNYITVKSFPGEWAVISDGATWTLGVDLPASTSGTRADGVIFLGSESYPEIGYAVKVENEIFNVFDKQTPSNTWGLLRGANPTAHAAGQKGLLLGTYLKQQGSYVRFMEFEITSTLSTNRVVGGQSGNVIGSGLDLSASGSGNKAINLIIHNVGHPGIGFWSQGSGGEINGCLIWGVGCYDWNGTLWTRGSAIYAQNSFGMATIKNCINFRNFTSGGKVYGETGPVLNFGFYSNIVFDCPDVTIEGSSGSTSTSNLWFDGNVTMGTPQLSYVSLSNRNEYFINNIIVNGAFAVKEHTDSFYTNNTVFFPQNMTSVIQYPVRYESAYFPLSALNIVWDYNRYYLGASSYQYAAFQFLFGTTTTNAHGSDGGGSLRFDNDNGQAWKDWSGFDSHSTYQATWPTNFLKVSIHQSDYDSDRWHLAVVNTDTNATNATVAPSALGFNSGDAYILRDAQDYFHPITTQTWTSGSIFLPLNRTNVSVIRGTLTHFTNSHSNSKTPGLFNAFVLTRVPVASRPESPQNLRIVGP